MFLRTKKPALDFPPLDPDWREKQAYENSLYLLTMFNAGGTTFLRWEGKWVTHYPPAEDRTAMACVDHTQDVPLAKAVCYLLTKLGVTEAELLEATHPTPAPSR